MVGRFLRHRFGTGAIDPQVMTVEHVNWFDTARELTDRWHHQAQIRVALDRPALDTREVYHPVLDCFMRVLPYAYRQVDAPLGTLISVRVDGPAADDWQLYRALEGWLLTGGLTITPDTVVTIPGDVAWRLFTKGIARAQRERRVAISGDSSLADGRHHPKSCSYREPASGCPRRCVARPNSAQVSEL
ncbi:MAG: hypothetical protein FJW27_05995 [Acidimicrobiia bacterium]|nr:hypothetical protein [Acidimicrobiia bacterium]